MKIFTLDKNSKNFFLHECRISTYKDLKFKNKLNSEYPKSLQIMIHATVAFPSKYDGLYSG